MTNKTNKTKTDDAPPAILVSICDALGQAGVFDSGGECSHWLENLDLLAAWIYRDYGTDGVRAWFTQPRRDDNMQPLAEPYYDSAEALEDPARELDRKGLHHVGDVLRSIAKDLPSAVEKVIEDAHQEWVADQSRAYPRMLHKPGWYVAQWVRTRSQITGESWNTLVRKHDLEDWVGLKRKEAIWENGKVRYVDVVD